MDVIYLEHTLTVILSVGVTVILVSLSTRLVAHDRRWRERGRMIRRLQHPAP
jgi:hypothetical protein